MRDPIDTVTGTLPVTSNCAIRMQFAGPDRIHTLVLTQDLFQQWMLIQSWGGSYRQCGGPKPKLFESQEEGLAYLERLVKLFERREWTRIETL